MRNFANTKRIVIKVGTNTLTKGDGIDTEYIEGLAGQIAALVKQGKQVLLVTSGAIGMGARRLQHTGPVKEMKTRQACAAIGQPLLMHEYHRAFANRGQIVAQVLLTAEVLKSRKSYLNLKTAIEALFKLGVVPILNENDSVATDEIGTAFGDNDRLSALVASKIDADVLILLTDIDALYDKNPKDHPDAQPIKIVYEITDKIVRAAGGKGSMYSTGGMKTKIAAAKIAAYAGCRVILAHGHEPNVLEKIISGDDIGTLFMPKQKLSNRTRWILNNSPEGTIIVDDGALKALRNHKSLLPSGVKAIEGTFEAGTVVMINNFAKAVVSLSSEEIRKVAGRHSREIRKLLSPDRRDVVAVPEDIVFIDNPAGDLP
ncbi:MAG: glutamate 5-kinase [Planctomycetes bacterium]|nr:glutamate 5-kinase [Planctomycetota bacterium]